MFRDTRLTILLAATPALTGSVLLMHAAGVSSSLMAQQALIFVVPAMALWFAPPRRSQSEERRVLPWGTLALVVCLFLPLVANRESGPERWLLVGPLRLYVAPVVVPSLLMLLGTATKGPRQATMWPLLAVLAGSVALLLQPDAAQLTAFACACMPILLSSRYARTLQALVFMALLACVIVGWRLPDPLQPVTHVEGALHLAAGLGPLALSSAVLAVLLPSAVLLWHAWRIRSAGFFAAAIYYATIVSLAPLQITPVPLLGFGAGPILGYVLLVLVASRRHTIVQ
jgi:hypothetical protein